MAAEIVPGKIRVKLETPSVNPNDTVRMGWPISRVAGSGGQAECTVAVGRVDGLVVGHVVGEAVPQDLQPAVP